jgi:hypothetical protein
MNGIHNGEIEPTALSTKLCFKDSSYIKKCKFPFYDETAMLTIEGEWLTS